GRARCRSEAVGRGVGGAGRVVEPGGQRAEAGVVERSVCGRRARRGERAGEGSRDFTRQRAGATRVGMGGGAICEVAGTPQARRHAPRNVAARGWRQTLATETGEARDAFERGGDGGGVVQGPRSSPGGGASAGTAASASSRPAPETSSKPGAPISTAPPVSARCTSAGVLHPFFSSSSAATPAASGAAADVPKN